MNEIARTQNSSYRCKVYTKQRYSSLISSPLLTWFTCELKRILCISKRINADNYNENHNSHDDKRSKGTDSHKYAQVFLTSQEKEHKE